MKNVRKFSYHHSHLLGICSIDYYYYYYYSYIIQIEEQPMCGVPVLVEMRTAVIFSKRSEIFFGKIVY